MAFRTGSLFKKQSEEILLDLYSKEVSSILRAFRHFNSLLIEGPQGCGKSTLVNSILEKHPELSKSVQCIDGFNEKLFLESQNQVQKKTLFISNIKAQLPHALEQDICRIEILPLPKKSLSDYLNLLFLRHNCTNTPLSLQNRMIDLAAGRIFWLKTIVGQWLQGEFDEKSTPTHFVDLKLTPAAWLLNTLPINLTLPTGKCLLEEEFSDLKKHFFLQTKKGQILLSNHTKIDICTVKIDQKDKLEYIDLWLKRLGQLDFDVVQDAEYLKNHLLGLRALEENCKTKSLTFLNGFTEQASIKNFGALIESSLEVIGGEVEQLNSESLLCVLESMRQWSHSKWIKPVVNQLLKLAKNGSLNSRQMRRLCLASLLIDYLGSHDFFSHLVLPEDDLNITGIVLLRSALDLRRQGDISGSIDKITDAIGSVSHPIVLAELLKARAIGLGMSGRYQESYTGFMAASQEYSKQGLDHLVASTVFNASVALENLGEVEQARGLLKTLPTLEEGQSILYSTKNFSSWLSLQSGDLKSAQLAANSVALSPMANRAQKIISNIYLAEIYYHKGELESAQQALNHATKIVESSDHKNFQVKILLCQVKIFIKSEVFEIEILKEINSKLNKISKTVPGKYLLDLYVAGYLISECLGELDRCKEFVSKIKNVRGTEEEPHYNEDWRYYNARLQLLRELPEKAQSGIEKSLTYANIKSLKLRKVQLLDLLAEVKLKTDKPREAFALYEKGQEIIYCSKRAFKTLLLGYTQGNVEELKIQIFQLLDRGRCTELEKIVIRLLVQDRKITGFNKLIERNSDYSVVKEDINHLRQLSSTYNLPFFRKLSVLSNHTKYNLEFFKFLQQIQSMKADIIIDLIHQKVIVKDKLVPEFFERPVLLNLLRFFFENRGKGFSKEDLVRYVWQENYNTEIHDSLVYVTVYRIKQLLKKYDFKSDLFQVVNDKYRIQTDINYLLICTNLKYSQKLNSRQLWALNYLKYNDTISNKIFREKQGIAPRTALRDLNEMIAAGYITSLGSGRTLIYSLSNQ